MTKLIVKIDEKKKESNIIDNHHIQVDGKIYEYELNKVNNNCYLLHIENKVFNVTYTDQLNGNFDLLIDGYNFRSNVLSNLEDAALTVLNNKEILSHHESIKAPMPGLIVKILKNVGESIVIGEPAALLEAMKMENEIRSPATGTVTKVNYKVGDSVEKDNILFEIE